MILLKHLDALGVNGLNVVLKVFDCPSRKNEVQYHIVTFSRQKMSLTQ